MKYNKIEKLKGSPIKKYNQDGTYYECGAFHTTTDQNKINEIITTLNQHSEALEEKKEVCKHGITYNSVDGSFRCATCGMCLPEPPQTTIREEINNLLRHGYSYLLTKDELEVFPQAEKVDQILQLIRKTILEKLDETSLYSGDKKLVEEILNNL